MQMTLFLLLPLVRALVWSVVTYGSEGWIIHKAEEKQIEAFEMWCYRKVLRVSWIDHRTNEWALSRLEVEKSLLARIRTLKLSYYGHVMTAQTMSFRYELACKDHSTEKAQDLVT